MSHMLHDFPKYFQRPPFRHGSSMQHGCNMTRDLRMLGRAFTWAPSTLRMPPNAPRRKPAHALAAAGRAAGHTGRGDPLAGLERKA
jgi:hypothetical protein